MADQVFIVVSTYQQSTDGYGGRMTNFDIHDVYATGAEAEAFIATADRRGPSVPEWQRTYSIVARDVK